MRVRYQPAIRLYGSGTVREFHPASPDTDTVITFVIFFILPFYDMFCNSLFNIIAFINVMMYNIIKCRRVILWEKERKKQESYF